MTVGAEIQGVLPQAEGRQRWPEAPRSWKKQGRVLPWRLQRDRGPAGSLISDLCPQNMTGDVFAVARPPVCGTLLPQSRCLKDTHCVVTRVAGGRGEIPIQVCLPLRAISFPPFLQSAVPPALAQTTVRPLPGFSATGQRVDTSRTSHVVTVIMILPH